MAEKQKIDRISKAIQVTVDVASDLVEALERLNGEFETYERKDHSLSNKIGNAVLTALVEYKEWSENENKHDSEKRKEFIFDNIEPLIFESEKFLNKFS